MMTSSLRREARRRPSIICPGFTLIEMLVVMGIILVLIALLLPALNRAYRNSVRTSMAADLQVISEALEAYRGDFGDYPRPSATPTAYSGAVMLCWALIAPGPATGTGYDGAAGPGFRLRATGQGKIYGPYLPVDRFVLGTASTSGFVTPNTTGTSFSDYNTVIADRYGNVILYFPANRTISPTVSYLTNATAIGVVPQTSMYNFSDNSAYLTGASLTMNVMRYKLGDTNYNGKIDGSESPATVAPYILWSAGPDGKFGPPTDSTLLTTNAVDDDVTYPVLNDVRIGFAP